MKHDLEPCPFCEGEAHLERKSRTVVQGVTVRHTYVRCMKCGSRGSRFLYRDFATCKEAEGKAVEAWNRRASDENACANKCGLECIRTNVERVCVKPEKGQCPRCEQLVGEGLDLIQQLEADNSRLNDTIRSLTDLLNAAHEETAAVKRERDAAVKILFEHGECDGCKHLPKGAEEEPCISCNRSWMYEEDDNWEWQGVCPENTEVQKDE